MSDWEDKERCILKPDETTLKAHKVIDENEDIIYRLWASPERKISDHIQLRKIRDLEGRLHLDIVIDSDTTVDELEQNWHKILDARGKLAVEQGDDLSEYFSALLQANMRDGYIVRYEIVAVDSRLESRPARKKPSWAELAMDANFDLLVYYLVSISQSESHPELRGLARNLFEGLLRSFGFSHEEINLIRETGLKELELGRCPWDIRVYPIHREMMRLKVRSLLDKYGNRLDAILKNSTTQNLRKAHLLFFGTHNWTQASELLAKTFPKSFHRYEEHLNARMSELLSQATTEVLP